MELKASNVEANDAPVPSGWYIRPVVAMGEVVTGKALAKFASGSQRPYLRTKNVFDGRIKLDDVLTMPMTNKEFEHFGVLSGDVLLNEGQSLELVGRCAIYNDECEYPCAIQNQLIRFRARSGVSGTFASHLFRYCQQSGVFAKIALKTTSIAHLGGKRFERLELLWPSSENEQRAIATALSDVDALLAGLDRLIAKKRNLKQAAMQQLLTGDTRLKGFNDKWLLTRLGDHVTFLSHGTNSRAELRPDGPVKYLHYGDIHACTLAMLEPATLTSLPEEKAKGLDRLRDGDLVFADASEDLAGISKSVEIQGVGDTQLVAGLHTITARFNKGILADGFKAYLQFCPVFSSQLRRLAAGTKVYATIRAHIASVEMYLPGTDEQSEIAAVFQGMSTEIEILEQRQAKTADLKQGMMQELLTGKTRLISPEVAHA